MAVEAGHAARSAVDEVDRLVHAFDRRADASVASRLDALLDLERLTDPRIVPFLIHVLADPLQPTEVRVHIVKRLRNGRLTSVERQSVVNALQPLLTSPTGMTLRLQAALALAEFSDIDGVTLALGELALDEGEPLDLRYSAFTSLQRAGATSECVRVLRRLSRDDALGQSARAMLAVWKLG
jgi:hypothetical protein